MSNVILPAVVFLIAVLVVAEFVWLREEAEARARSPMNDSGASRLATRLYSATYAPRQAVTAPAAGPEGSA